MNLHEDEIALPGCFRASSAGTVVGNVPMKAWQFTGQHLGCLFSLCAFNEHF